MANRLPDAFEILAEVLTSPAFRAEDIERLKAERLAKRMQLLDEPRGLADESFSRFVYARGSRYSEPMSGSTNPSRRSCTKTSMAFYRKNYRPRRRR